MKRLGAKLAQGSIIALLFLGLSFQATLVEAAARWPSLAQQLQQDAVQPGSALERLIRNNQEFAKLRPDELNDGRGIPPWLRVFWRKAHPEGVFSADDPTGGYPLILKEIHEWMLSHQDLIAGALQQDGVPGKSLAISSDLRISGLQVTPRSESDIRINYWNPNKIIAAANDIEAGGMQAQFFSTDGGATWGQTSLPLLLGDAFQGDPAVEWTSDGSAWATTLGIGSSLTDVQVLAYRSNTGGASWFFDGVVSGAQTGPDKEMLWADHSATSPFKDNLYAIWNEGPNVYLNRRTGPGGSWGTPLPVDSVGSLFNGQPGTDVKTNSFGDLFAFWPAFVPGAFPPDKRILLSKSTDGGQTFQPAVTVGHKFGSFQIAIPAQATRKVLIYVSGAAYRTASKDLVYAAWTDLTGSPGCSSNSDQPGNNTASSCKTRIWFARSTNGGAAWSTPVMLNDQPSLNDQFFPHLAVDETNGTLAMIYYDTVGDPGRRKTDIWYQSSFDDGVTWTSPVKRVTTAQSDETTAGSNANQYGDYTGLSGNAGVFFPSWTDRRSNAREEIWTAKIQDSPPVAPKDAVVLSQSVPTAMLVGQSYPVSVTLENTGSLTWSPVGSQCNAYRWGSLDSNWSPPRAELPGPVNPGAQVTLNFSVTPPPVSGTYDFQWRMVHECVEWFGAPSTNVAVNVRVFDDVPAGYWAKAFIEAIYYAGLTSGCALNPRRYCPETNINRTDTAVFLIAAKGPAGYVPPPCTTPMFTDVPCSNPAAPWINEFARRGITAGCGGGNYCPTASVSRGTIAYFLLATLGIPAPTTCTGMFADVPCSVWYAPWVEELARRGITAGCGGGNYCPESPVNRAQLAVFVVWTFGIPLN